MRTWRSAMLVLAVITAAALVSGCNDSTTAEPSPPSTETQAATASAGPDDGLWDPCTLPDSALTAAGLDISTKENDVAGVVFDGWKVCSWKDSAKTYAFGIASTTYTLADARARTDYTDYADTTVASHRALQSRPIGSSHDYSCYLSVELGTGMVEFDVLNRHSAANATDPCTEVRRLAEALSSHLPGQ